MRHVRLARLSEYGVNHTKIKTETRIEWYVSYSSNGIELGGNSKWKQMETHLLCSLFEYNYYLQLAL